jgi:hypothetical protein
MKNHETKTGSRRSPVAPHHQGAQAHSRPRRPVVRPPRSSFPSRFPPVITLRCLIFAYITPRIARGLYIFFLSCFRFKLFLSGVDLSFGKHHGSFKWLQGEDTSERWLPRPSVEGISWKWGRGRRDGRRRKFTPEHHDRKHWGGDKSW